jgi:Tol biopolymer transport system component
VLTVARIILLISIALALTASSAHGTSPGHNGLIVFTRYRLQNAPLWSEVFVARPDGGGVTKVSHSMQAVEDDGAQWSPHGDLIVFQRSTGTKPRSVWIVRPDGSGQHRIRACSEPGGCNDSGPSFAPDGKHIVFVRDWGHVKQGSIPNDDQIDHSAIVETDLEGGHAKILRRADGYKGGFDAPRISPDGRQLLFGGYGWNPTRLAPEALYVVELDGSGLHRLTPFKLQAQSGDWSPDAKTILFEPTIIGASELTPGTNLYTVAANGTYLHRITNVGGNHYVIAGSFSPDGRSFVFATDANAAANPRGGTFADVFTMRLGTSSQHPVTRTANLDGWPSWGSSR